MLAIDTTLWTGWLALGFARVAPVFFMLPFLNANVLTSALRNAVIVLVVVGLVPPPGEALPPMIGHMAFYLAWVAREAVAGLLLGLVLGAPFWIFHAVGCAIDYQRGATVSGTIDPANGVETSDLATFFSLFAAVIFLQRGGMLLIMRTLADSYRIMPLKASFQLASRPVIALAGHVAWEAMVLAAPVMATLLLSELLLGVLSRFAPQLNAFSVSLTIKTALAMFVLLLYIGPVVPARLAVLAAPPVLRDWVKDTSGNASEDTSADAAGDVAGDGAGVR